MRTWIYTHVWTHLCKSNKNIMRADSNDLVSKTITAAESLSSSLVNVAFEERPLHTISLWMHSYINLYTGCYTHIHDQILAYLLRSRKKPITSNQQKCFQSFSTLYYRRRYTRWTLTPRLTLDLSHILMTDVTDVSLRLVCNDIGVLKQLAMETN